MYKTTLTSCSNKNEANFGIPKEIKLFNIFSMAYNEDPIGELHWSLHVLAKKEDKNRCFPPSQVLISMKPFFIDIFRYI